MKNQMQQDKKSAPLFATAKNKPLAVKSNLKAGEVQYKHPGP